MTPAVAQLDGIVEDVMERTGVPGLAVSVVHDDAVVYAKGFGVREAGTDTPVSADTVFQIASNSKPISSSVVAAAVGRGLVTWDDPVHQHLPWFELSDPWVSEHVTIGDLFAMRSGLPGAAGDSLELMGYDRGEILRRLKMLPLAPFRTSHNYANFSLTAGAEAVATASGTSWEALAQEVLFEPLGMASTSALEADFRSREDSAALHVQVDGTWQALYQRHPDAQAPAGGVSSTVNDLARWMRMLLANGMFEGEQIAPAEALAAASTPQVRTSPTGDPAQRPAFYGYGQTIQIDDAAQVVLSHSGAFTNGASSALRLVPEQQLGIVVLANGFIGATEAVADAFLEAVQHGSPQTDTLELWQELVEGMLASDPALATDAKPASPAPARSLEAYAGRYANEFYGTVEVVLAGDALKVILGPSRLEILLEHWTGDQFVGVAAWNDLPQRLPIAFEGDGGTGRPTTLTLPLDSADVSVLERVP